MYINADGSLSFHCPASVCGTNFYFGREQYSPAVGKEGPATANKAPDGGCAVHSPHTRGVLYARPAYVGPSKPAEDAHLRDIVQTVDMTWLGTDKKSHPLAFMKNSTCGGLYFSPSQPSVAAPDLACSLSNLDTNSLYIKRLNSHRFGLGPGLKLAVSISSALALKARDRNWRRELIRSPSLRLFLFFARTFGKLKPNILKTNPGLVINDILLKHKHLYYPLTELFLYGKSRKFGCLGGPTCCFTKSYTLRALFACCDSAVQSRYVRQYRHIQSDSCKVFPDMFIPTTHLIFSSPYIHTSGKWGRKLLFRRRPQLYFSHACTTATSQWTASRLPLSLTFSLAFRSWSMVSRVGQIIICLIRASTIPTLGQIQGNHKRTKAEGRDRIHQKKTNQFWRRMRALQLSIILLAEKKGNGDNRFIKLGMPYG